MLHATASYPRLQSNAPPVPFLLGIFCSISGLGQRVREASGRVIASGSLVTCVVCLPSHLRSTFGERPLLLPPLFASNPAQDMLLVPCILRVCAPVLLVHTRSVFTPQPCLAYTPPSTFRSSMWRVTPFFLGQLTPPNHCPLCNTAAACRRLQLWDQYSSMIQF